MNVDSLSSSVFPLAGPYILAQWGCGIRSVDCWLKNALTGLRLFVLYTSVVIATPAVEGSECLIWPRLVSRMYGYVTLV